MKSISGRIFPRKAWMYMHEADLVENWDVFSSVFKVCGPQYLTPIRVNSKTYHIIRKLKESYGLEIN